MSDICIVLARLNDKGFSVILENTNIDRELTIVIPEDFSIVRFAALASSQSFRLVGIIEFLVGMKNLFRWLYGEIDTISESGLIDDAREYIKACIELEKEKVNKNHGN